MALDATEITLEHKIVVDNCLILAGLYSGRYWFRIFPRSLGKEAVPKHLFEQDLGIKMVLDEPLFVSLMKFIAASEQETSWSFGFYDGSDDLFHPNNRVFVVGDQLLFASWRHYVQYTLPVSDDFRRWASGIAASMRGNND